MFSLYVVILLARLGDVIAFNPFRTIGTNLFFPHRDDFLQSVNAITRGVKDTSVAVGGGAGDEGRRRFGIQLSDALDDGDPFDCIPLCTNLVRDLFHFFLCHWYVRFIFKVLGDVWVAAPGLASYHAGENRRRARGRERDLVNKGVDVDLVFGDGKNRWKG